MRAARRLPAIGSAVAWLVVLGGGARRAALHGPFHRTGTAQPDHVIREQLATGEIWGKADRFSSFPSVDAWTGPLPEGKTGIEFYTSTAPEPQTPPGHARWHRARPGVRLDGDWAKIKVTITSHRLWENVP